MTTDRVLVRTLGQQAYLSCWQAMQAFTNHRDQDTPDEIWLLEHFPVFTQGQNGKPEHIIDIGNIPLVQTDRGGQVTYHGTGQLMVYTLIDLKRKKFHVRELVTLLENSVIDYLATYQGNAYAKPSAPGVYLQEGGLEKKICSIGLRIRRGCSYHGIALNVTMDLAPFSQINPCGHSGLKMAQLSELAGDKKPLTVGHELVNYLMKNLRYTTATFI